jgi:photoactive yellow protein
MAQAARRSITPDSRVDLATLDLLPDGVVIVDGEGTVLYYNAREEQIAGRRREEVIGRNFFTEVAPCTKVAEFYGRFRQIVAEAVDRATFAFEFPFAEGARQVEITLCNFGKKEQRNYLISVRDISELRAVRDQILRSERLEELGEVAAGVAHNFNNLLAVIRGNAELMLRRLADDDYLRVRTEQILKASDDGAEIVRRIRAGSRQTPEAEAAQQPLAVNDVVKEAAEFVEGYLRQAEAERAAHIVVDLDLASGMPQISGAPTELREVFLNLLRNAVDAIPGAGRITIRTFADAHDCFVRIADSGQGMPREVLDKLFRPLFTTKGKHGMGMGLATGYAIVRRHGGDTAVESTVGEGTAFTVRIPATRPPG